MLFRLVVPALLLAGLAPCQQFGSLQSGFTPFGDHPAYGQVLGDFDGDGDLDAVVLRQPLVPGTWPIDLLRNDGEGRFEALPTGFGIPNAQLPFVCVAFDVDGDLDLDLVHAANSGLACQSTVQLLRNNGSGAFTASAIGTWPGTSSQMLVVDLDADGDRDLVLASRAALFCTSAPPRLLANNGAGVFTDVTAARLPTPPTAPATGVASLDLQGDGRADLVFEGSPLSVFVQQANGSFVAAPLAIPFAMTAPQAVDLDADGDLDLIGRDGNAVLVLRADSGNVWTPLFLNQGAADEVRTGDVDGDGDHDVLIRYGNLLSMHATLWRQDPGGVFVDATSAWLEETGAFLDADFGDTDGDGDLDLLHSFRGVLHNDGSGRLVRLEPWFGDIPNCGVVFDVDGDGRVDVVGSNGQAGWWRSHDGGYFERRRPLPDVANQLIAGMVARLDLEGDGDDDVWFDSGVLRNDGAATFTDVTTQAVPTTMLPMSSPSRPLRLVRVGDLDGDGRDDVFLGYGAQTPPSTWDGVLINDGFGNFSDETTNSLVESYVTQDAALFDADGDGDLDLGMVAASTAVALFHNDGGAVFTEVSATRLPPGLAAAQIQAGDLDGDGDVDIVLGGAGVVHVLRNQAGTFTPFPVPLPPLPETAWPELADIDVDGDLDLGLSGYWLRNDGAGVFTLPANTVQAFTYMDAGVPLADIDGDGDPDRICLLRNLHRQLENVLPPRLGRHGEVALHAQRVDPTFTPVAALYFAMAAAPLPLPVPPFGSLQLDPATTTPLLAYVVPGPGPLALRYPCPNAVSLLGVTLWMQAVTLNGPQPGQMRLGNAVALTVQL